MALGDGSVNPAQLLLVMARAWLEPNTASFPVPDVSTLPRRWAEPERSHRVPAWATHAGQFWCYRPVRWKTASTDEQRGRSAATRQDEQKPPLHILSMMHAEEREFFMEDEDALREHSRNVRALTRYYGNAPVGESGCCVQ